MKTTLTIEESARLIELGVDAKLASKADCCMKIGNGIRGIVRYSNPKPIFTLEDILSILPKSYFSEEYYAEMTLCIEVLNGKWFVNYRCYCGGELAAQDVEKEAPELIDALNQLAIWCLTEKGINLNQKDT